MTYKSIREHNQVIAIVTVPASRTAIFPGKEWWTAKLLQWCIFNEKWAAACAREVQAIINSVTAPKIGDKTWEGKNPRMNGCLVVGTEVPEGNKRTNRILGAGPGL